MRVKKNEANNEPRIEIDLRLMQLERKTAHRTESSEDCYCELTQALQEALTVIERSIKQ